jgi:hypothetical protein
MFVFSQKMTKRRNLSVMTTAGMANGLAIVPRWNLAFSVALRAYQSDFYIDNGSSMRALTLYFLLNQALAFLLSVSSPECAGYFLCFIVSNSTTYFHFVRMAIWVIAVFFGFGFFKSLRFPSGPVLDWYWRRFEAFSMTEREWRRCCAL